MLCARAVGRPSRRSEPTWTAASPTHASLEQSIGLARRYRPRRTLCVGMGDELEHEATNTALRRLRRDEGLDVQLAHDGLFVPLAL